MSDNNEQKPASQRNYLVTLSVERQTSFLYFFPVTSVEVERHRIQGADSERAAGQIAVFKVQGAVKSVNILSVIDADQKSLTSKYDVVVETKFECNTYKASFVGRYTVTAETPEQAKALAILDGKFDSQKRLDELKKEAPYRHNLRVVSVVASIYSEN